jgi:hypothetical protein
MPDVKEKTNSHHGRSVRQPMSRIIQIHELIKKGKFPNYQKLSQAFTVSKAGVYQIAGTTQRRV